MVWWEPAGIFRATDDDDARWSDMEYLELLRGARVVAAVPLQGRAIEIGSAWPCDLVVDDPQVADRQWVVTPRGGTVVAYDVSVRRKKGGLPMQVPLERSVPLGAEHALRRRRMDPKAAHIQSETAVQGEAGQPEVGQPANGQSQAGEEPASSVGNGGQNQATDDQATDRGPGAAEKATGAADSAQSAPATAVLPTYGLASTHVRLVVGVGPEARSLRLDGCPLHVGRDPSNDLVLVDRAVSGRHCRLEWGARSLLLRDLGSRNGTYIHGVRVERAELSAGSRFKVGRTELRLLDADAPLAGASLRMKADVAPGSADTEADRAGGPTMVATSTVMLQALAEVRRVAPVSWPALLRGETGSGKEGLALALHRLSPRAQGPFVSLNGGALAPQLVESELFGHERGSFTGASNQHRGVFEQADGGTLFLDEVGELSLDVQTRLLRVLEGGEVRRVGAPGLLRVNVRLVCATHRDLPRLVAEGRFRADLYYRLAQIVIDVPPLRARPEDISLLATHFLVEMQEAVGPRTLSEDGLARLLAHPFPGNVRELRNVLGMAALLAPGPQLDGPCVDRALRKLGCASSPGPTEEGLRQLVAEHGGNLSAAARALGWPRSTLRDRLAVARGR